MEKQPKAASATTGPRKRKAKATVSEPKNVKFNPLNAEENNSDAKKQKPVPSAEEIGEKYPMLKDDELVKRFLSVPMTNNQKGRIRQLLRDNLKGTSDIILPDVIYHRIQAILKGTVNLTDTDLRKLRILYNMLRTSVSSEDTKNASKVTVKNKSNKKPKEKTPVKENDAVIGVKPVDVNAKPIQKQKGPKRYVVFVGNLPVNVDKDQIMKHFSELSECIKDIRIPKREEGKKSAIAYVELANEPSYEFALSKHHSMLGNRRINILYTTQKKSKTSKPEAKSKTAKLLALQKSGKLLGSVPLNKKRSQRRKKMKAAIARDNALKNE